MRLSTARIEPLADADLTDEQRAALGPLADRPSVANIFRTLAHAPRALEGFLAWGSYILSRRNRLPARERELVILRTGFLCRSGYEFAQHDVIGREAGLSVTEIEAVKTGPSDPSWSPGDRALLDAADELHRDQFVSDATWMALGEHFDDRQRMDVVFTVGQYTQVSMLLNTFGVQLDAGLVLDPDLDGR